MIVQMVVAAPPVSEPAPAEPPAGDAPAIERQTLYRKISDHIDASIGLSAGLRFDELEWSIAGNASGTNPNILSDLDWKRVLSHQLTLSGDLLVNRHFYCRGHANMAWIKNGSVRDSDYRGDNRTQEYSRSINDTNGDELYDLVAGAGYPFYFQQNRLFLAPLLGMSWHAQNFRITDGTQVISEEPPSTPPIGPLDSRLNSTYSARWIGLWIGCDLRYQMAGLNRKTLPIEWGLSMVYHFWGEYSAEADWNLRGDLAHPKSFEHEADGRGGSLTAKCHMPINQRVRINLIASYTRWTTDEGEATIYPANGTPRTTQLNKVTWESHSVMLGVDCRFF